MRRLADTLPVATVSTPSLMQLSVTEIPPIMEAWMDPTGLRRNTVTHSFNWSTPLFLIQPLILFQLFHKGTPRWLWGLCPYSCKRTPTPKVPVLETPAMLLGSLIRSCMTAKTRNSYHVSYSPQRQYPVSQGTTDSH